MTEWIRYDLGDDERRALALFADYLKKYKIIYNNHSISYY
jgi:predicted solute-binding protein